MQINPAQFHIKFVKHAVVADTKFEFWTALQPVVREIFQSHSHFINLALHGFTDAGRQIVKCFGKCVGLDLERRRHDFILAGELCNDLRQFRGGIDRVWTSLRR